MLESSLEFRGWGDLTETDLQSLVNTTNNDKAWVWTAGETYDDENAKSCTRHMISRSIVVRSQLAPTEILITHSPRPFVRYDPSLPRSQHGHHTADQRPQVARGERTLAQTSDR